MFPMSTEIRKHSIRPGTESRFDVLRAECAPFPLPGIPKRAELLTLLWTGSSQSDEAERLHGREPAERREQHQAARLESLGRERSRQRRRRWAAAAGRLDAVQQQPDAPRLEFIGILRWHRHRPAAHCAARDCARRYPRRGARPLHILVHDSQRCLP